MRLIVAGLTVFASISLAQAEPLRVVNTARNDVLNVREFPSTQSRIIGVIPPDGRSIEFNGESRGAWLFVRYRNVEGWVDQRFVMPEAPPVRRGRVLSPEE